MARFSAVTSDDSGSDLDDVGDREPVVEEADHDEQDSGSSAESSSSDSDMLEDELLPQKDDSGSGSDVSQHHSDDDDDDDHDEGDDEDDHDHDHDDEGKDLIPTRPHLHLGTSSSSKPRADPSIIPWAQHIGVDAQKMHVMQTSLFRMPEEAAAIRALDAHPPPTTTRRVVVGAKPLHRKHSRESDGDPARFESREVRWAVFFFVVVVVTKTKMIVFR